MKKIILMVITTSFFIFFTGCSDEEGDLEPIEDTDDIETLISTNQQLVQQMELYKNENQELLEIIEELEEENRELKDNILTYRQELIEKDNLREEELTTREILDELAKDIFQAMHEQDHFFLEEIAADNIIINSAGDTIDIYDDDGRLYYTFHYISLESVNYIRQTAFQYEADEGLFISEYSLSTGDTKDYQFEGGLELTFVLDDEANDWKLSRIVR